MTTLTPREAADRIAEDLTVTSPKPELDADGNHIGPYNPAEWDGMDDDPQTVPVDLEAAHVLVQHFRASEPVSDGDLARAVWVVRAWLGDLDVEGSHGPSAEALAGIETLLRATDPAAGGDLDTGDGLMASEVAEHLPPDVAQRYWRTVIARHLASGAATEGGRPVHEQRCGDCGQVVAVVLAQHEESPGYDCAESGQPATPRAVTEGIAAAFAVPQPTFAADRRTDADRYVDELERAGVFEGPGRSGHAPAWMRDASRPPVSAATPRAEGAAEEVRPWTNSECGDRAAAARMAQWLHEGKPSSATDQWIEDLERLIVSARGGRRSGDVIAHAPEVEAQFPVPTQSLAATVAEETERIRARWRAGTDEGTVHACCARDALRANIANAEGRYAGGYHGDGQTAMKANASLEVAVRRHPGHELTQPDKYTGGSDGQ